MIFKLKHILYVQFIIYFLILIFLNANPVFLTLLGITIMSSLIFVLLIDFYNDNIKFSTKRISMFFYIILLIIFFLSFLFSKDYLLITISSIFLYSYYFYRVQFDKDEFLNIINIVFLFYLFISILAYFNFIPYPRTTTAEIIGFKESILGIKGLIGYTGSTAHIDSFSVLIACVNFIFFKNKKNLIVIVISILTALSTGSMTAIVLIPITILSYLFVRKPILAGIILTLYTIIYLLILFALSSNTHFYVLGQDLYTIMNAATHGRSVIWERMWVKMIHEYEWYDYIFGINNFKGIMQVPIWWSTGWTSNPHNSLLNIFFRFPLFFVLGYTYFIFLVLKNFNYKLFTVVLVILMASLSNVEIFGLQNPIYFIILIYTLTYFSKFNKKEFN